MDQYPQNGVGINGNGTSHIHPPQDGILSNGVHEPATEELERELPMVSEDMLPIGEIISRMTQSIYAELTELAETMPNMSDALRKRTLADFVVKTKKQVVKLYVMAKWARDAEAVQKAMNVVMFFVNQNEQFNDIIAKLKETKDELDPARLRNHDLLTSLDVLTTGSYRRLPSSIKKFFIPSPPLTDDEVSKILGDMEDAIRYRLRMHELIPPEMFNYRIADGRVHFTVPKLFEAALCLRGAHKEDGWFFVDVEFLFNVGGDTTGMQEFPRHPQGPLQRHIADEADGRLAFYLRPPEPVVPPGMVPEAPPPPPTHELPEGIVDAPLVRVFNFLQMMSMSYQLEILWYQAERLRSLGWAEYLQVKMTNDRKTLTISYWMRKPAPIVPGRPPPRHKLPPLGGTLTISIVPTQAAPPQCRSPSQPQGHHHTFHPPRISTAHAQPQQEQQPQQPQPPYRKPKVRVLMELQQRAKMAKGKPSDEVEGAKFEVKWEPQQGALGVSVRPQDARVAEGEFEVDADDLDVEALIRKVIRKHARCILSTFQGILQYGPLRNVFGPPGEVVLIDDQDTLALRVRLCADEVVVVAIDPRTGRLTLKDTGDLAAAGRGPYFARYSDPINENPSALAGLLAQLRFETIVDVAEQKANYLGLRNFRKRSFNPDELMKLGPGVRGTLYVQLTAFPSHYLVLVVTDEDFRYALISVKVVTRTMFPETIMEDIGWLDVQRVHASGQQPQVEIRPMEVDPVVGEKRKLQVDTKLAQQFEPQPHLRFTLETQVLRELYSYCCARVAYTKVEQQLKFRNIMYKHYNPMVNPPPELAVIHSSLAPSIPALCVQASDILAGRPAAEAAMPNIRVIPLNWWSERKAQVVTCVKLKYVQQPVGKRAGSSGTIIRPSKRIIYDTREAVVTFLSEDVDQCVAEFLEEWAKVSKMVVIAREVAQMAKEKQWNDVRLLSFDLQTVEFAYSGDYAVSITCTDQLSPDGGKYELHFSRAVEDDDEDTMDTTDDGDVNQSMAHYNPHETIEPFVRNTLKHNQLAQSLHRLVALLRNTLPIVTELEYIRVAAIKSGDLVDTFAKTATCYRVLFGDLRHALDFRLMSDSRVAVLDGSSSLFPQLQPRLGSAVGGSSNLSHPAEGDKSSVLLPIPNFRAMVQGTSQEVASTYRGRKVTPVGIGVICDAVAVRAVVRSLYQKVQQGLKDQERSSLSSFAAPTT